MPWLDSKRSDFISALEYFWNSFASARKDIVFIACGSATSWITNKILKNHGGLHNRVTQQIYLQPFTLKECEEYYASQKIVMNNYEMVENYMIFGGIPYYLSFMRKDLSMAQNVDKLLFSKKSPLCLRQYFCKYVIDLMLKIVKSGVLRLLKLLPIQEPQIYEKFFPKIKK